MESWRGLTALRGDVVDIGLVDFWKVGAGGAFDFGLLVRRLETPDPSLKLSGKEKIEALGRTGRTGFSSITSELANRMHSESRSTVGVEGEPDEATKVRGHSTGGTPEGGRSGGG